MVNYQVGFKQMDDFVHYFVNGMPVYCHEKEDKNGYRFNRKETRGQCHKFTAEKIKEAQRLLDLGHSQQGTAKAIGVSESAIRYHINAGTLKKSRGFHPSACYHCPGA